MFGNKKNKSEKKPKFSIFGEKKEVLEVNVSHIEKRKKQILTDIAQVEEHTANIDEAANLNVGIEIALMQTLDELKDEQAKAFADYQALCESIKEQAEAGMELVEQNKHFTSPSKQLSEAPAMLREKNKKYEQLLMETNASNYEEKVLALRHEVSESYKDIQELENTIHYLVLLLKDSNMAATRLFMKFQNNDKLMSISAMRDFSEDMTELRDDVVGLRNCDEEIAKCTERTKLQMEDIKEEMQEIQKEIAEIESDISYLMDMAESQED